MKLSRLIPLLLLVIIFSTSPSIKANILINSRVDAAIITSQADPATELNKTITEGIKLLENKEYEKFLKRYPLPEEFEKILKEVPFEQLAAAFAGESADRLLKALKVTASGMPEFNPDKTEAKFKIDVDGSGGVYLVFKRINDLWYIKN